MYRDILAIKDAEHSPTKVFIFQDLGDLYLEQNKLDLAQQYYQKALDMKTDPEVEALDKYWLSASLYGLAIIAHEKMQYAEARQWYAQALHELNPLNGPYRAQNIVTNIERATDWKKPVPEKQYRAY